MSEEPMADIKTAVAGAIEYLNAHPDEAHYTDEPVTAVLEAGLRVRARAGGVEVVTDMPTSVGGGGSAPSPGAFYRAGLANCLATLIALRAAVQDVEVTRLEVTIDSESDDRGILGADPAVPAGPLSVRAQVLIEAAATADEVAELINWARDHCPFTEALGRVIPLTVTRST
jgi:uncharacterized OsmC-like protein